MPAQKQPAVQPCSTTTFSNYSNNCCEHWPATCTQCQASTDAANNEKCKAPTATSFDMLTNLARRNHGSLCPQLHKHYRIMLNTLTHLPPRPLHAHCTHRSKAMPLWRELQIGQCKCVSDWARDSLEGLLCGSRAVTPLEAA
jgi:hypothetical protein